MMRKKITSYVRRDEERITMTTLKQIIMASVLLTTMAANAEKATKVLKCNITADGLNMSLIGCRWLGHGVHYSLKPLDEDYPITYKGVEYAFEASFSTINDNLSGSFVSIKSNGYVAQSEKQVTLKSPTTSWDGISINCDLFEEN
jgi:hypothetical protein